GQMSYDLSRLARKGLIRRIPHTNTYTLTPDGLRIAMFYTKVHDRLLAPLCAADQPPAPTELRQALKTIDDHIDAYIERARLGKAAKNSRQTPKIRERRIARRWPGRRRPGWRDRPPPRRSSARRGACAHARRTGRRRLRPPPA